MRAKPFLYLLTALGFVFLSARPGYSGTFEVTSTWYDGWERPGYQVVFVKSRTVYTNFSSLDDHWAVQTSLNTTADGPGLDNWSSPDYIGGGKNGNTLFEGMTVLCDGSCSANQSLERPPCPNQVQYLGRGNSVIFRTGSSVPQAWQNLGTVNSLSCIEPEPDPGCARGPAEMLRPVRLATLTPLAGQLDPCAGGEDPVEPPITGPESTTPIVIKLDDGPFLFSRLEDGVEFDIDADGELEAVSWTDAEADLGFLVFDFNLNGVIDDGSELFGGMTHQPLSDDPNGFRALGLFDLVTEGGDGDGLSCARSHNGDYEILAGSVPS